MNQLPQRRMPFGAETDELGGTCFRLLAPAARIGSQPARAPQLMTPLADGWFELPLADVGAGARYRFLPSKADHRCRIMRRVRNPRTFTGRASYSHLLANLGPEPLTPTPEMPQGRPDDNG